MTTTAPETASEVGIFRHQAGMVRAVVRMNLESVTHEESLARPEPGGNCLNWVLGHLLVVYNHFLPLVGQAPVMEPSTLARYDRGSAPLTDPAEALPLADLVAAWERTVERVDAGLGTLTPDVLDRPAPHSPSGDPDETVRSLVSTVLFHQAYHAGQAGVLRRVAGKPGAIA
ncbi:MAG TPA: DinB family protein [Longimicrobium sp.]|nr:DinB family protein [Longimicrobium sp.]